MAKKIFEIDKDSIVRGTKGGYFYCTTTPPHPFGEKRKDRKKKYIYLHRALLEQKLNRYLKPEEQSDHKDGNKEHNIPSNLELKTLGDHQKSHSERGNHFWKKSPRNKPGRAAAVAMRYASGPFIEEDKPVRKFLIPEDKKDTAKRVVTRYSSEEEAQMLYKDFLENHQETNKNISTLYPDYNGGQAEEATDYLLKAFKKFYKDLSEDTLKRVRNKFFDGIT